LKKHPQGDKGARVGYNVAGVLLVDRIDFRGHGEVTNIDAASIEFVARDALALSIVQVDSGAVLKFPMPMRRGDTPAKVIFETPTLESARAKIPEFDPVLTKVEGGIQHWHVDGFRKYAGKYSLDFGLRMTATMSANLAYLRCFSDRSEHYFFGDVRLFGARFRNDSEKPLVFRITRDEYVHIGGTGTIQTVDGQIARFSD